MARRNLRGVLPLADAVARSMGLSVDWTSTEGRAGLLDCLKAYTQACAEAVRRDAGEVVDTPPPAMAQQGHQQAPQRAVAAPATQSQGHSFRDLYDAWEKAKPGRPVKTLATYSAAANRLESMLPGRTVESLTREDGRNIVAALLTEAQAKGGKAQNTAVNLLGRFKTLLAQADDMEWIPRNPLQGRVIEREDSERTLWRLPDLIKLFDDPLFTAYQLPADSRAGGAAAYWLPLLSLFTGARISELAQLHTEDVKEDPEAGPVVSIKGNRKKGQRVKNKHSVRTVPVHPELLRLGLLEYWKETASRSPGPLWPDVRRTQHNGAGGKVSQWFGEYKTAKGFASAQVFHSFRHTMETRLRALEVPAYLIDAITGHAGKTVSAKYDHPEPATLRPVLARLQFPGLHLPRVYPVPAGHAKSNEPPA
jgi:integrase